MSIKNKTFDQVYPFNHFIFTNDIGMGKENNLKEDFNRGYIKVPRSLLLAPGAPKGIELNLILILLAHWNPEHGCFPSIPVLATELNTSESYVKKLIKKLESKGILKVQQEVGRVNYYTEIDFDKFFVKSEKQIQKEHEQFLEDEGSYFASQEN